MTRRPAPTRFLLPDGYPPEVGARGLRGGRTDGLTPMGGLSLSSGSMHLGVAKFRTPACMDVRRCPMERCSPDSQALDSLIDER